METIFLRPCTRHVFNAKPVMSNTESLKAPRHRKRRKRTDTHDNNMILSFTNIFKTPWCVLQFLNLLFFYSTWVISSCGAFNLDTRIPIVKSGIASGSLDESYFGYSVALHRTLRSKEYGESVILVGAPRDDNLQPNTHRSGALWQCPLTAAINVSKNLKCYIIK